MSSLETERWNAEYNAQRYEGEPPIPFVKEIIDHLGPEGHRLIGLYVGCGNGRNFIPLIDAGLRLHGMDISDIATERLLAKRPDAKVFNADFSTIASAKVFDYILALQVFQHGDITRVNENFNRASMALNDNGKLFLRVNSVATEIKKSHKLKEKTAKGGATITYEEGPKEGMDIHFFTQDELMELAAINNFQILAPLREVVEQREAPMVGRWVQWESIWQKK